MSFQRRYLSLNPPYGPETRIRDEIPAQILKEASK